MKKKNIWFAVGALIAVAVIVFVFLKLTRVDPAVEAFLDDFYDNFNAKHYAYIYNTLSNEELKNNTKYSDFEDSLKNVYLQFGEFKQRKINFWNVNETPHGDYLNLQYKTMHQNGKGRESFTLKKSGDSWSLVYYNIKLDLGQLTE